MPHWLQRKNYLPDKPNQFRFAGLVVIYILAYTLLILVGFLSLAFLRFGTPKEELVEEVAAMEAFYFLTNHFPIAFLLAAGVVILHSLYFSHRIFGPLVQLKRVREKVVAGDLSQRLHMRARDLLRDVQYNLNLILDSHENRIKTIQELHGECTMLVNQLKKATSQQDRDSLLAELLKKEATLDQYLNQFKTATSKEDSK